MSTEVEIQVKSTGPGGMTAAVEVGGWKLVLDPFMLEDYLDAVEARAALADPENTERIPWEDLKGKLGL